MKFIEQNLRIASSLDIPDIVNIHQLAFPNFYLTNMGTGFLKAYYSSVLAYPNHIVLVVSMNNQVLGFVVGFKNPMLFYVFFKSRRFQYLWHIFLALVKKPSLILRTFTNTRRISDRYEASDDIELSSIAVHPDARGIGSILLKAFLRAAQDQCATNVVLTTDAYDNETVNSFYERHRFKLVETYNDGNRMMNRYKLPLK